MTTIIYEYLDGKHFLHGDTRATCAEYSVSETVVKVFKTENFIYGMCGDPSCVILAQWLEESINLLMEPDEPKESEEEDEESEFDIESLNEINELFIMRLLSAFKKNFSDLSFSREGGYELIIALKGCKYFFTISVDSNGFQVLKRYDDFYSTGSGGDLASVLNSSGLFTIQKLYDFVSKKDLCTNNNFTTVFIDG